MTWWQRQHGGSTRGRVVALLRRGRRSVEELAQALGLTDNAVRAQLVGLERDGIVSSSGVRRLNTAGKPPTVYEVTADADTVFSSAYAPTLAALVAELGDRLPAAELEVVLRATGRRLAAQAAQPASFDDRVGAAGALLAALGGDAELLRTKEGYTIRAFGCPLGRAVASRPETCCALEELLSEMTGAEVREHCDRTDERPSCRFLIRAPAE